MLKTITNALAYYETELIMAVKSFLDRHLQKF
jgi:hypothetical protein